MVETKRIELSTLRMRTVRSPKRFTYMPPQTTRKSTLIHRILSQKIRKCIWPRFILRLKMSTNRSKKLSCIITRILLGCQHNGNNTVRILGGMLKIEDFGRYVRIQSTLVGGCFFILGGGKVNGSTVFDYYYGDESSQFSFYRIPRQLVAGQQFKKISTDAKLLYGLLLDRMGLSARNGWYDDAGRVYIFTRWMRYKRT